MMGFHAGATEDGMTDRRGTHGATLDAEELKAKIEAARSRAKELRQEASQLDGLAEDLEREAVDITDMEKIEVRARALDRAMKGSFGGAAKSDDKGSLGD
jgi:ABC-type phosphate transport system auxiliary subunit